MNYDFELSEVEEQRLFEALRSVRLGDSMQTIIEKLGKPSKERTLRTHIFGRFRSFSYTYNIKIVDVQSGPSMKDHAIRLYFNKSEQLEKICYCQVAPLLGEVIPRLSQPELGIVFTIPPV